MAFGSGQSASAGTLPPAGQASPTPAGTKGLAKPQQPISNTPIPGMKGQMLAPYMQKNYGPYGPNLNQSQPQIGPMPQNPMVDNNYANYPGAQAPQALPAQGKGAVGQVPPYAMPDIQAFLNQQPQVQQPLNVATGYGGPNVLYSPPNPGGQLSAPVQPVAQPATTTTTAQPPTGLAGLQQRKMDHEKERMMRQQDHDQRRAAFEKERMMRQGYRHNDNDQLRRNLPLQGGNPTTLTSEQLAARQMAGQ